MSILAMFAMISPAMAQWGCYSCPWDPPYPGPNPVPGTTYNGWGCYPTGTYTPGNPYGPMGGWCGFYNSNVNFGSMGMVSTQAVVMHILFPAIAPNCPISQLADWTSKPERVDHYNVNGQVDYYFVMTYDASGNLTKVELFDAAELLVAYTDCVYNASGKLVKTLNYDETGTELSYTDFIYNAAGQLVNVKTYVNGLPAYTLRCYYNTLGQVAKVSQFNQNGALKMYTNCFYNTNKKLSKTVSYSATNAVLESRTYAYNTSGKMLRVNDYKNTGALNGYSKYMWNTGGQPTNAYFYNASNAQVGRTFCYFNLP